MRLDTPRLHLRPLDRDDVTPTYVGWLNDPAVSRFLESPHDPRTFESVAAFVEAANGRDDEHLFGIFLNEAERHIGVIKLGPVHPVHQVGEVSLLIGDREVWGQGYAAEAITRLVRHAFEDLGLAKLSASLHAANLGSERAFLKAGFEREGLRHAHYDLDGARSDVVELGLVSLRPRRRWRLS